MSNIDPKKLSEELQKAKFQNKPAHEVISELKNKSTKPEKKNPDPAAVGNGEPVKQGLISKAKSFTESMVSRGLNDKKCESETYSLRVLSCHGDSTKGLPPCPRRMDSEKFKNSYYCGACGCGDKPLTQLTPYQRGDNMVTYTKLHYPKVSCPLQMPGFSNYISNLENTKTANDRKQFIEFNHGVEYIREHSNGNKQ